MLTKTVPVRTLGPTVLTETVWVRTLEPEVLTLSAAPTRSPDDLPRGRAGGLAVAQHRGAAHQDVKHAGGELLGIVVGRVILDLLRIEDHDVGVIAGRQRAALREP